MNTITIYKTPYINNDTVIELGLPPVYVNYGTFNHSLQYNEYLIDTLDAVESGQYLDIMNEMRSKTNMTISIFTIIREIFNENFQ